MVKPQLATKIANPSKECQDLNFTVRQPYPTFVRHIHVTSIAIKALRETFACQQKLP